MLHTSDWHLGRRFHRVDLLDTQAAFVDHLIEVVRTESVDLVVLAGDVYDRALPPVDAVMLLDEALSRLAGTGATVAVSSGNHDSARRLGFGSRLLARAGVHLRTDPAGTAEPVLVEDRHGPVAVYPVPYLEPAVLGPEDVGGPEPENPDQDGPEPQTPAPSRSRAGHDRVLGAALSAVRRDAASRGRIRTVVAAHAFVVGGSSCDSERDISVAGVQAVPAALFDGFDYVALGHLHRAQRISDRVRYSGSPLAYSFSEHGQIKGSWLIDLGPESVTAAEFLPAPVPRPLAVLRGKLSQLLADPVPAGHEDAWCQITLTDDQRPAQAMARVRERFPHTVELRFEPETGPDGASDSYLSRIRERSDLDVCTGFLDHVRTRSASAAETEWLRGALTEHRLAGSETAGPREAGTVPSGQGDM
jgi:exonuclease SbcD